ncbi:hypothetical protein D0T50_02800 [Bacteroides sp. 214]|uniref:tetratricopeptide repeat protein n=1 Tax=Bacteroides sp. 214 TaxID=2302935 RepID=UPI0013D7C61B|nr:tetratricopeptide repeat protein [Bacteroides sp. 214]NDW11815.1 hypothetical protein [Bacteroides sp. 214]
MKYRYTLLFLLSVLVASVSAQTLDQARAMFLRGEYGPAKPVFERFLKTAPNNANYNYWYGVCCMKTGESEKSIKHLELAHKRKVQNAPYFLGQAYDDCYRFEEAMTVYEEYISAQTKKKQDTTQAEALLEKSKLAARMLKGVEEVCVIDSFVVEKHAFLKAYKISEESGKLYMYDEYFKDWKGHGGTVYETELGNKVYYGHKQENDTLDIYAKNKMLNEWGTERELPGSINSHANTNYPFVMTDGITIYYASDGATSIGGYDIFVTRYNSAADTYLLPESVGMPFNSPANDYMFVIDEFNQLGWFATDRNQPADTVCVYVFVPNTTKQTYNYEAMEPEKIRSLARLNSIRDTWKDETVVTEAKQRLQAVMNLKPRTEKKKDFVFVINDNTTYYTLAEFKSTKAKELFRKYQQKEKDYAQQVKKLEEMRAQFAAATQVQKDKLAPAILDLERRVEQMYEELTILAIHTRNEEYNNLK